LLYARIDARIDQMFADGLADEVRGLLDAGVPPNAVALRAIGYKEVVPVILGHADLATAVEEMRRNTRKLARQQLKTWFRADDPNITWVDTAEEAIRVFE
jgi:tRNA dimethylallyltransferase